MERNGIDALLEVTKSNTSLRDHNYEDLTASMAKMTVGSIVKDMQPIMKNELKMVAEAVVLRYSPSAQCYFVEVGQLCDYMKTYGIGNFKQAIKTICDVNEGSGATVNNTAILIDEKSCEKIVNDCKECSKTTNEDLKAKKAAECGALKEALEIIDAQGVRCVLNPA